MTEDIRKFTASIERTRIGDQYVVPGAERSARQAAQARGALKRSAKPQQPADFGLFAPDSRLEPELFDHVD